MSNPTAEPIDTKYTPNTNQSITNITNSNNSSSNTTSSNTKHSNMIHTLNSNGKDFGLGMGYKSHPSSPILTKVNYHTKPNTSYATEIISLFQQDPHITSGNTTTTGTITNTSSDNIDINSTENGGNKNEKRRHIRSQSFSNFEISKTKHDTIKMLFKNTSHSSLPLTQPETKRSDSMDSIQTYQTQFSDSVSIPDFDSKENEEEEEEKFVYASKTMGGLIHSFHSLDLKRRDSLSSHSSSNSSYSLQRRFSRAQSMPASPLHHNHQHSLSEALSQQTPNSSNHVFGHKRTKSFRHSLHPLLKVDVKSSGYYSQIVSPMCTELVSPIQLPSVKEREGKLVGEKKENQVMKIFKKK